MESIVPPFKCLKKIWDWICSHAVEQPCQFGTKATRYLQSYVLFTRQNHMECILSFFLFSKYVQGEFLSAWISVDGSEIRLTSWGWYFIPLFTGFYTSEVVVWAFFPSTVSCKLCRLQSNFAGPSRPSQLSCSSARHCCCFGGRVDIRQVVSWESKGTPYATPPQEIRPY